MVKKNKNDGGEKQTSTQFKILHYKAQNPLAFHVCLKKGRERKKETLEGE